MARYILIHGAWATSAGWAAVAAALSARGHQVEAPDLPGHGAGAAPSGDIGQADYVAAILDRLADGPPAILVGHSMGGMVVAQAASHRPDRVRACVFVAALLPRDGDSLLSLIRTQQGAGVQPHVLPGPVPGTTILSPGAAEALFPEADPRAAAAALAAMSPQSNKAQKDPAVIGPGLAALPKAYVFCTRDRVVTPDLQRRMVAATPCEAGFTLDCGHVPQLTRARDLAAILDGLAG